LAFAYRVAKLKLFASISATSQSPEPLAAKPTTFTLKMKPIKIYLLTIFLVAIIHLICKMLLFPIVTESVNKHSPNGDFIVIGLSLLTIISLIIGLRYFYLTKKVNYLILTLSNCAVLAYWIVEFNAVECVGCRMA